MEYLCGEAKATKSYNKVGLYLCYYGNANTAYFDDAQIYKEEFGESYTYDEKGNLVSAAELDQRNSTFSYDNNNLTSVVKPEGRAFSYKYDSKHNLLSGKNNSGVQNS